MGSPTHPPIFQAQNTPDARRRVAAQARLYSDAKQLYYVRVAVIGVLAVASSIAALLATDAARTVIGAGGGILLLALSVVGGGIEKRRRLQAAATQEEFDTAIFQIPWNDLAAERPSSITTAQAAERYRGGREKDWYPDTRGTHRPFDVLICQISNLGWGASTHRIWAWALSAALAALIVFLAIVARASGLAASDVVSVLILPALAPAKELVDQVGAHFETARDKAAAEARLSDAWAGGMKGTAIPSEQLLRTVQDRILSFRQRNHYVPDWLDNYLRENREAAMQATAADRVAEAARHGHG